MIKLSHNINKSHCGLTPVLGEFTYLVGETITAGQIIRDFGAGGIGHGARVCGPNARSRNGAPRFECVEGI